MMQYERTNLRNIIATYIRIGDEATKNAQAPTPNRVKLISFGREFHTVVYTCIQLYETNTKLEPPIPRVSGGLVVLAHVRLSESNKFWHT